MCSYNVEVSVDSVKNNLTRIRNQIFRLLPTREENGEWIKPLETLIIELTGFFELFPSQENILSLVCKLEGLKTGGDEVDFMLFRRTIFETCSLVGKVIDECQ